MLNCVQILRSFATKTDQIQFFQHFLKILSLVHQLMKDGHAIHETRVKVDRPRVFILGLMQCELQLR